MYKAIEQEATDFLDNIGAADRLTSAPMKTVGQRLKSLREQTGLSIRAVAEAIGFGDKHTSYGYYETAAYKKTELPIDLIRKLDPVFVKKGVIRNDLWNLAGVEPPAKIVDVAPIIGSRKIPNPGRHTIVKVVTIPELQIRLGGANGGDVRSFERGDGLSSLESRVEWQVPGDWAESFNSPDGRDLIVFTVVGNSMSPDFPPGTKVLVNAADRVPSPPGPFVVYDGMSVVIKLVNYVPFSEPPTVRLTSRDPAYPPYERTLDEAYIQGRVVGHWARD
jgi:hypothetical protein